MNNNSEILDVVLLYVGFPHFALYVLVKWIFLVLLIPVPFVHLPESIVTSVWVQEAWFALQMKQIPTES